MHARLEAIHGTGPGSCFTDRAHRAICAVKHPLGFTITPLALSAAQPQGGGHRPTSYPYVQIITTHTMPVQLHRCERTTSLQAAAAVCSRHHLTILAPQPTCPGGRCPTLPDGTCSCHIYPLPYLSIPASPQTAAEKPPTHSLLPSQQSSACSPLHCHRLLQ